MKRSLIVTLVGVLVTAVCLGVAATARADVSNASSTNVQDGQNSSTNSQSGRGKSGSAVGGQVSGVVSGGPASIDARNTSRDSTVTTGSATGSNSASSFVGLNSTEAEDGRGGGVQIGDVTNSCRGGGDEACENVQDGNNRYSLNQTLAAVSGDGVGGQVIGLVAIQGADPSIVASNTTDGVDVETGAADGTNDSAAFVGLNSTEGDTVITADLDNLCVNNDCENVQDGNNRISSRQSARAHSGDGVAGQVIGAVTNRRTSIDARNHTRDSFVETGEADAANSAAYFAGLNAGDDDLVITADITDSCTFGCDNVQDGSNRVTATQSARATSGDGVAGEVIGVVNSGGGVSVVASNTTTDSDIQTGSAEATNDLAAFVGLNASDGGPLITADITNSCTTTGCENVQDGSNRFTGSQSASAASGDGVGGQVLGIVAAGNTSLDARNRSEAVVVETGESDAHNDAAIFVGLNSSDDGPIITADIDDVTATNVQDGTNRKTLSQSADATSGDAVAGQVSGVVTSAGGSARLVLANTSADIDASTGPSDFSNSDSEFVGLNFSTTTVIG